MPLIHIWMTYEELGGLLACTPVEARQRANDLHLDCQIGRNGIVRVKLNMNWVGIFIEKIQSQNKFARAAEELRSFPHLRKSEDEQPAIESVGKTAAA